MWNFMGGMRISKPMNNIQVTELRIWSFYFFFCHVSKGNLSSVHCKREEHVGYLLTRSSESVSKTKRSNKNYWLTWIKAVCLELIQI